MKKIFCLLISFMLILTLCSCGMIDFNYSKEQNAYKDTLTLLFDALDKKDSEAIYKLFSPAVRMQDRDLRVQIKNLMSVYNGPTDEIGWDGLLAGTYSNDYGDKIKEADTVFPVCCGNTYYWFYLKLQYENTTDKKQVGITQLEFYTADEQCIFRYDDDAKYSDSLGLEVYADKTLKEEVRCISGWPHKYSSTNNPLDINEVKKFLESSDNFNDFKAQFGEPNAEHIYKYYELPSQDGNMRYLEIGTDNEIYNVNIVDDFKYIETIFNNEN